MLTLMSDSTQTGPAVAVRNAATVALLRDGASGLEVLLLRRHPGHVFAANAHVFPGGACDPADDHVLPAGENGALGDASFRVAAIRECFEEAGLLVSVRGALPAEPDRRRLRAALNTGRIGWGDLIARSGLSMTLDQLVYFADWTTPAGAPKRYATRFYAAMAPADQTAEADGSETVCARWIRPAEALIEADAGRRHLMLPTRETLRALADYSDAASALTGLVTPPV